MESIEGDELERRAGLLPWAAAVMIVLVGTVVGLLLWQRSNGEEASISAEPATVDADELVGPQLCDLNEIPAGALDGQLAEPAFCNVSAFSPEVLSAQRDDNRWVDSFDRSADNVMFIDSSDYRTWLNLGREAMFWRSGEQLLLDMESDGLAGLAYLRPVGQFEFEGDRLVVEMDVAVGSSALSGSRIAVPEFVVVAESGDQIRQGETALRSFFDQIAFGCSADPDEVMSCELVDNSIRDGVNPGRIWRVSPDGADGVDIPGDVEVGNLDAVNRCEPGNEAQECTNRYRVELASTSVRVEVNDELLFEFTGLPPLPNELTDEPLAVFFVGYNSGVRAESVRLTFDRLAVNPAET